LNFISTHTYVYVGYYDIPCPFESQPVEPQAIVVNIVAHKLKMHFFILRQI